MELKKTVFVMVSALVFITILTVNSGAEPSANAVGGIPEKAKQRYVESFRKFTKARELESKEALRTDTKLADDSQRYLRKNDKLPYIVDGLYRVKIGLYNDLGFPTSPLRSNPRYPNLGGVSQAELDSFLAKYHKEIMSEYFGDNYLTFYQTKILNISTRYISVEALIRDAAEFELLLKDSRIVLVNSVTTPPPLEIIE